MYEEEVYLIQRQLLWNLSYLKKEPYQNSENVHNFKPPDLVLLSQFMRVNGSMHIVATNLSSVFDTEGH